MKYQNMKARYKEKYFQERWMDKKRKCRFFTTVDGFPSNLKPLKCPLILFRYTFQSFILDDAGVEYNININANFTTSLYKKERNMT